MPDSQFSTIILLFVQAIAGPLVVGLVLYFVTSRSEKKRVRAETIRDLMTHRGDFASSEFRRSLNKVAIIFHDQQEIRDEVRYLYETINDASKNAEQSKRAIVGLIYKLCQKNRFKGLTEYDIDQAFTEKKQTPIESSDTTTPVAPTAPAKLETMIKQPSA
jgi:hypothetical protein